MLCKVLDLERIFGKTHTLGLMNLMGQDTENSCKRKLDLVGGKGSDETRLAINQQTMYIFQWNENHLGARPFIHIGNHVACRVC
jgi:hypothetical protein